MCYVLCFCFQDGKLDLACKDMDMEVGGTMAGVTGDLRTGNTR